MKFIIAIEPGTKKTAFGVAVPDLPGCFSAGDTVEEAFDNAREAIGAHLRVLAAAGKDLPEPRPMSEWQAHEQYRGWIWGIVEVPVERMSGTVGMLRAIRSDLGGIKEDMGEIKASLDRMGTYSTRP